MPNHKKTFGLWVAAALSALSGCTLEALLDESTASPELTGSSDEERVSATQSPLVTSGYQVSVPSPTLWENGSTTFTVRLTRKPTHGVTLRFALDNGSEATLSTDFLAFTVNNWSTPQTVTVTGVDDAQALGMTEFHVLFTASISTDNSFQYSQGNPVVPAPIRFFSFDREAGIIAMPSGVPTERGDGALVSYKLSRQPVGVVTLAVSSNDGTEGTLGAPSPRVLRFDATDWNLWKTVTLTGVDDSVIDNDPLYKVRALVLTAPNDPAYAGQSRWVDFRTYEDDQTMTVASQTTGPFTCRQTESTVTFSPSNYPDQVRSFRRTMTDEDFVAIRILHVNLGSTYMRAFTTEELTQESTAFYHMRHRVIDATRGLLWPNVTEITVPRFWDRGSFTPGNFSGCPAPAPGAAPCRPSDFGLLNMVEFTDYASLRQEIEQQVSLANYDFVMVSMPVDGVGGSVVREKIATPNVGAFAIPVLQPPPSRTWQEGKVMVRPVRPGAPTSWKIWMHELAHQVEWALERGGRPQMHNPDHVGFWFDTFGPSVSNHWSTQEEAHLAAFFWTQRGQWPAMTTAADLPKGSSGRRTAQKEISTSCTNTATYREAIRDL